MAAKSGIEAGKAYISLSLNDDDAMKATTAFATEIDMIAGRMAAFGTRVAAVGGAIVSPFALGVKNMLQFTRALDFSARRLGVSATELSRLQIAAETFGITLEGLEIAVKTLGERLFQLEGGAGDTARALKDLGITPGEFLNAGTFDRFFMVAEGLAKIEDAGKRAGLGLATLGEAGFAINAFLAQGPAAVRQLADATSRFAVREESITAVAALNQQVIFLKHSLRNLTVDLATQVTPAIIFAAGALNEMIVNIRLMNAQFPIVTKIVAGLGGFVAVSGGILLATAGLLKFWGAIGKALVGLSSLIKAVKAAGIVATISAAGFSALATAVTGGIAGIALLLSTDVGLFAIDKVLGSITYGLAAFVFGLGKLISLIPGLNAVGESMAKIGAVVAREEEGRLGESLSEFTKRREEKYLGGSGFTSQGGFGFGTPQLSSAGIGGGFASQQTLGLKGAESSLDQIAENTKVTADIAKQQQQQRQEYRGL